MSIQRVNRSAVAQLHDNFNTRVEKLAHDAAAQQPELAAPLEGYVKGFVSSFNASRGRWPTVDELQRVAARGADGIAQATAELPANLNSSTFKEHAALSASHHNHHADTFAEDDRIYFELSDASTEKSKVPAHIQNWLTAQGYTVTDPEKGLASNDGKNHTRIGRLLQKADEKDMLQDYTMTRSRGNDAGLMMVISRKPEDIARCSSARAWTSCMNEYGQNAHYVEKDIERGTVVAYLVSAEDPDINNPISRRLIKPYYNEQGDRIMMPDNGYGIENNDFRNATYEFCDEYFNKGKTGEYILDRELYADGIGGFRLHEDTGFDILSGMSQEGMRRLPAELCRGQSTAEELLDYLGYQYEKQEDGRLHLHNEELDLSNLPMTALPDMSHVSCKSFKCNNTYLGDLVGAPQDIESLNCSANPHLATLKGTPAKLKHIVCHETGISNLNGLPKEMESVDCAFNDRLTSLKGAPEKVGSFSCSRTAITNLEGAPKEVNDFNCASNLMLTSLEGAPQKAEIFRCNGTAITSLQGAPKEVDTFIASGNRQLKTLEGGPEQVRYYYCRNTAITDLQGAPKEVETFDCGDNRHLRSSHGAPEKYADFIYDKEAFEKPALAVGGR